MYARYFIYFNILYILNIYSLWFWGPHLGFSALRNHSWRCSGTHGGHCGLNPSWKWNFIFNKKLYLYRKFHFNNYKVNSIMYFSGLYSRERLQLRETKREKQRIWSRLFCPNIMALWSTHFFVLRSHSWIFSENYQMYPESNQG